MIIIKKKNYIDRAAASGSTETSSKYTFHNHRFRHMNESAYINTNSQCALRQRTIVVENVENCVQQVLYVSSTDTPIVYCLIEFVRRRNEAKLLGERCSCHATDQYTDTVERDDSSSAHRVVES